MAFHTPIEIVLADMLPESSSQAAAITNVKHLASYNWIEAPTPTIAVPGIPAQWLGIKRGKSVRKDSGHVFIAQNSARHPKYPLEPLFRALQVEQPRIDARGFNIISDRNNIRKLLSSVDPSTDKHANEDFTIAAECIGDTVIFCRQETKDQEFIGPNDFRGYGHEFEKAYTRCDITESTGHHRIIEYQFCGLAVIIRHEVDGFDGARDISQGANSDSDLLEKLAGLSLSATAAQKRTVTSTNLTTIECGRAVPLETTLEIKTRAERNPLKIDDVAPQLWVSQTTLLVRAHHNSGFFQVPKVEDVKAEIVAWEQSHRASLSKLAVLLKKIIEVVKTFKFAKIKYDAESEKLAIVPIHTHSMLPADLHSLWLHPKTTESAQQKRNANEDTPGKAATAIANDGESNIQVCDVVFKVDKAKFPGLQSFALPGADETPAQLPRYIAIPHFKIALDGVTSGFRQCFRGLGTDLSVYKELCNTYVSLSVDVLAGQNLDEILSKIRAARDDVDEDLKGNKRLARDSAFRLVYFLHIHDILYSESEKNKIYNTVFFIVSHPGTFRYKIRHITRAMYDLCILSSPKQRIILDKWTKVDDIGRDDATTDEESSYNGYDSDYSWGSNSS